MKSDRQDVGAKLVIRTDDEQHTNEGETGEGWDLGEEEMVFSALTDTRGTTEKRGGGCIMYVH